MTDGILKSICNELGIKHRDCDAIIFDNNLKTIELIYWEKRE
jgi:hypothetical protein